MSCGEINEELPPKMLGLIRFLIEDHAFSTEFLVTAVQEYYLANSSTAESDCGSGEPK